MQNRNHLNLKRAKIMSKNTTDKEDRGWELSIGFYPGILFGARTYYNTDYNEHVIYFPFIDVALIIDN
jgi:hypothetical protein